MNKQFHIRGVKPETHEILTQIAEDEGLSVTQYLNRVLDEAAAQKSRKASNYKKRLLEAFKKLPDLETSMTGAELVREDRDNR